MFLSVVMHFCYIHHSLTTKSSQRNRLQQLCSKECVYILLKNKKISFAHTHISLFFFCKQTSLLIVWNCPTYGLLEALWKQISVAKVFFCIQTRRNLEFSLGLKRHSSKIIIKKNFAFFLLSFSSINMFGHWEYSTAVGQQSHL